MNAEERNQKIKLANAQNDEDLEAIVKTPEGFRWFKRFFSESKVLKPTFTGNSQSYYNDGQRELSLKYFKDVARVAPERFVEMELELITEE